MYDKLVSAVNGVDVSEIVLKTQYNTDKSGLKKKIDNASKKISDTSELIKKKQTIILKSLRLK